MSLIPAAAALLSPYRATIKPEWIDYNGHLRDAYYGLAASLATDEVMDQLGLDHAYRERTDCTLYTLEAHMHYLHEVRGSDDLIITTSVLDFDRKRIHISCRFTCSRLSETVATAEMMLLHVAQGEKPTSAPFPEHVISRLETLKIAAAVAPFAPGSRKIELQRR